MAGSLSGALATLRSRHGQHVVRQAAALSQPEPWRAGVPVLDGVLAPGGLPRGRVTVLAAASAAGPSGRLTVLQGLAAHASRCCDAGYVDLVGTLDPGFLADLGADLAACLVVAPGTDRWGQAFAMGRSLVRAGLPWIAVALGADRPPPARWERQLAAFADAVGVRDAVAVIAAPAPLAAPLAYTSSLTLTCASGGWHRAHGDIAGMRVRITTTKSRVGAPGAEASLLLRYPRPYATAEVVGLPRVVGEAALRSVGGEAEEPAQATWSCGAGGPAQAALGSETPKRAPLSHIPMAEGA